MFIGAIFQCGISTFTEDLRNTFSIIFAGGLALHRIACGWFLVRYAAAILALCSVFIFINS